MLFIFVLLIPPHPTPLPFSCICGNAIHYACDGVCVSRGACMCNKKLIEAVGGKLFIFMLFSFGEWKSENRKNLRMKIWEWKNLRMKTLRMKKSENENLRIKKSENGKSETNYNLVLPPAVCKPFKKNCIRSNDLFTRSVKRSTRSNDLVTGSLETTTRLNDLTTRSLETATRHLFAGNIDLLDQIHVIINRAHFAISRFYISCQGSLSLFHKIS